MTTLNFRCSSGLVVGNIQPNDSVCKRSFCLWFWETPVSLNNNSYLDGSNYDFGRHLHHSNCMLENYKFWKRTPKWLEVMASVSGPCFYTVYMFSAVFQVFENMNAEKNKSEGHGNLKYCRV